MTGLSSIEMHFHRPELSDIEKVLPADESSPATDKPVESKEPQGGLETKPKRRK